MLRSKKITMLCQGPKQYKGLKSRKKKRKKKAFGFLIKKKGGRPKSMDGQALDLTKKRKEKVQPSPQKSGKIVGEPEEKTRPRYLGIPRSLGSSRCAVRPG